MTAKNTQTVSFDTARGRIGALMQMASFRPKMEALLAVAEFLQDTNIFMDGTGEEIVAHAFSDLRRELEELKKQLPFLMDLKVGSSSDSKASSLYEDVYSQLVDFMEPHVYPDQHGSYIGANTLCHSVSQNVEALIKFWLQNKDTAKFPLGE